MSIAKQVIQTYKCINHSRPLIPDEIHLPFNEVWEERSKIYPYMLSAKQGNIWYYLTFIGMPRTGIGHMASL